MTAMEFRLSPGAIRSLAEYTEATGLSPDEAVDRVLSEITPIPGVRRYPVVTEDLGESQRRFLSLLEELESVSGACEAAAISEGLPYGWARTNLVFARAFDEARQRLRDKRLTERQQQLAGAL